jgi:hypothetical protein
VITVVGIVLLAVGSSKKSTAQDNCFYDDTEQKWNCSRSDDPEKYTDMGELGRTLQGVGGVGIGVGLAAVGGGLLWYFLADDGSDGNATGTWVQPVIGPSTAGLSISGAF